MGSKSLNCLKQLMRAMADCPGFDRVLSKVMKIEKSFLNVYIGLLWYILVYLSGIQYDDVFCTCMLFLGDSMGSSVE